MKKILTALLGFFACVHAYAQGLPAGSIGSVVNPVANVDTLYTVTFTASTTGSDYIGFAFRQDPAFWNFTNPVLEVTGTTTNLLTNGNLSAGGPVQVTTNGGTQTIQAPANWGVWYQNGTYPAAAGTWSSGQWYDGAVGSYDGIYQGVTLTAGTSYTITFYALSTYQAGSNDQAMIGIYAGSCQSVSLAASACVPLTSSFTPIAVPAQTVNAGNPSAPPVPPPSSAPTVVSTTAGTPIVTAVNTTGTTITTVTNTAGSPTSTSRYTDAVARGNNVTVTRTTTVTTVVPYTRITTLTTPITTTTTTIPTTITTYSDGSTTTTNGTPVVTSSVHNQISSTTTNYTVTQSAVGTQSASASATGLSDAMAVRTFNAFLVDPLVTKDGTWITPSYQYSKTNGIDRTGGWDMGYQTTVENNTAGVGLRYSKTNANGYTNSSTQADNYAVNAYLLSKQEDVWIKGSVGYGKSNYTAAVSLPTLALYNNTSAKQNNLYADATVYGAATYYGFRPLIGITVNKSNVTATSTGSQLLNTTPEGNTRTTPTIGVRYEFTDDIALEGRLSQSQDFKTVGSIRAVAKTQILDNTYIEFSAGADRGSNYTAAVGMVGLRINF
jgi:hypothetical protein